MRCHDEIRTDSIWANGNITLESTWKDVTPGNPIQVSGYLQSRGNVKYDYSGEGNGWISGGVWGASVEIDHNQVTSGDVSIGLIGGNDSVRGAGAVSIEGSYDLTSTDIFLNGGSGDIRYNGSLYTYDTSYGSAYNGYTSLPTSYTNPGVTAPSVATPDIPTKPDPVYVDRNGALNEPGPDLQDKNVDVLYEAGLTSTVNLLEPNWFHFQTMAEMDDVSNPGAPHMIYDNGPGDSGTTLGEILFVWDATKPYSSQETVYNGDPDVDIIIDKLHWQHVGAAFEGTIVSRGDIYISSSDTNWFMGSEQILNLVAGGEIMSRTAGLTLAESNNCHYHFWAYGDIRLENMRFGLIGVNTFYGSFTAGNRVYYADNSFWTSTEFKWSRWALDPVAWVPPFKVLTWREV
ncbi:MAG: hypothetical protein L6427_12890 [Actinomycetia bacterium]|nr:hypothetical protein [Actinomycetes bacterium]